MIKLLSLFVFLLFLSFECWGQQETGYVIFIDSVTLQTTFINREKQVLSGKASTSSVLVTSRMGKFKATYDSDDENLRDGMIHCLRMAMDMWEDKMQFTIPVRFHVSATLNLSQSIEVKTLVHYSKTDRYRSRIHSLYKQAHNDSELVDSIFINANIDWNYSRLYDISGGSNNITTVFLKQIAHILGFGISVTEVNGLIGFSINRAYSEYGENVKIIDLDNPCVFTNRLDALPSYCINAELNGEIVMDSLVIREDDEITFSLICPSDVLGFEDKNISWQLCFPNDDGNEWSKMFGNGISSSFKLEKNFFTKNKYDYITKLFSWKVDEETGIVYNKGVVRAEITRKKGAKEVVEYPVRMEVLPWMPTVTILKYIELECSNGIWPYVELEITANNIKGGYVYTTDAAWLGATGEPFTDKTPMPFHVVVDWGSMGCGYGCIVSNDYGILTSSPVFPNKEDTTICSISHEGLQIQQHGDMVTVNFPCNADEVTIVGISGKQYYDKKNISGLRTSLPKGIYLLNITYQGKKQVYLINKKQ